MRRLYSLPIRWRLALTSAALTLIILLLFAGVVSAFTADRLKSDFDSQVTATALDLSRRVRVAESPFGSVVLRQEDVSSVVVKVAAIGDAAVRVVASDGQVLARSSAVDLGSGPGGGIGVEPKLSDSQGYRVASVPLFSPGQPDMPSAFLQYGRRRVALEATIDRVNTFLVLGVLAGAGLALLAGLAVARRAMAPIADLTRAAGYVTRTRDPAVRLPPPRAEDEVADLSRTLEEMLGALDVARRELEATLAREREFVADASHELRTPLTSVLANLELLEAQLSGESADIAGSALRSTQRMRRLVGDLLFLARADTGRAEPRATIDLAKVVRDATAEVAPIAGEHDVSVELEAGVMVSGAPDDLHRLVANLLQNAVTHTPPGTSVTASVSGDDGGRSQNGEVRDWAVLEVSDDGPGIPPHVRERIFERFIRAGGDGPGRPAGTRGGSGLGLAIVQTVARAHGGTVELDDRPGGGTRFVIRFPRVRPDGPVRAADDARAPAAQTSTTTGRTRGRRLRRS